MLSAWRKQDLDLHQVQSDNLVEFILPFQPITFLANSHTASCIPRHTPAQTRTSVHT